MISRVNISKWNNATQFWSVTQNDWNLLWNGYLTLHSVYVLYCSPWQHCISCFSAWPKLIAILCYIPMYLVKKLHCSLVTTPFVMNISMFGWLIASMRNSYKKLFNCMYWHKLWFGINSWFKLRWYRWEMVSYILISSFVFSTLFCSELEQCILFLQLLKPLLLTQVKVPSIHIVHRQDLCPMMIHDFPLLLVIG